MKKLFIILAFAVLMCPVIASGEEIKRPASSAPEKSECVYPEDAAILSISGETSKKGKKY